MSPIKNLIRFAIEKGFQALGIQAFLLRKKDDSDYVVVDRNYLDRYYVKNTYVDRYRESMLVSRSETRDSFPKQCRYYGVYQMVLHVLERNVEGAFAECGCWRGHSSHLIASMLRDAMQNRPLHIFDSFEGGLSEKGSEDKGLLATVDEGMVKKERQAFSSKFEEVAAVLSPFDNVILHRGWIPERFDEVSNESFAFVNLDLDLYAPIKDSLEFFYPRLSQGGALVVDDYGTTDWPGVKIAVDEFLKHKEPSIAIETVGSMIIVK